MKSEGWSLPTERMAERSIEASRRTNFTPLAGLQVKPEKGALSEAMAKALDRVAAELAQVAETLKRLEILLQFIASAAEAKS